MLKRFWKWLWPPEKEESKIETHNWSPWSIVEEKMTSMMTAFGGSATLQRRRCLECGISQEATLDVSYAFNVPCKSEDEEVNINV